MLRVDRPLVISDRLINRLLAGALLVLVVGIPVFGLYYVWDRGRDAGPSLVDRRTSEIEQAILKEPDNISLRLQLAGAYTAAARYPDAISQLDQVLKIQPGSKTAHLARGDALVASGNMTAATADYQAIVDITRNDEFRLQDTELEQALVGLASIQVSQGNAAAAIANVDTALQISRTDADAWNLLGRARLASGDPTGAVEPLRRAILFVPTGWPEPYMSLTEAYGKLGQSDEAAWATAMAAFAGQRNAEARKALLPLVSGAAAVDALDGLGMLAEADNDHAGATGWFTKALAIAPNDFAAQSGLGRQQEPDASTVPTSVPTNAPAASPLPSPVARPAASPAAGGNG